MQQENKNNKKKMLNINSNQETEKKGTISFLKNKKRYIFLTKSRGSLINPGKSKSK